eukprot:6333803-Prymnesium_polylepis.1
MVKVVIPPALLDAGSAESKHAHTLCTLGQSRCDAVDTTHHTLATLSFGLEHSRSVTLRDRVFSSTISCGQHEALASQSPGTAQRFNTKPIACVLIMRMVVFDPTTGSYPNVGAELKRIT